MDILKIIEIANNYGMPLPFIGGLTVWAWLVFRNRWPEREKYYCELLDALGQWKISLDDQNEYYIEPGSVYRDDEITIKPYFQLLSAKESEAIRVIRDRIHTGRLFLSKQSIELIEKMLSQHWLIKEMDAACMQEYIERTLPLVTETYQAILRDAKKDLHRSRLSLFLKKFSPQ